MKLWQKIYVFSLLLLIMTLNIAGIILIQKLHNDLLKKEVEKCLAEQKFISSELRINSTILKKTNTDSAININTSITSIVNEYINSINHGNINQGYIEILDSQNKILYTDVKFPISTNKDELENLSVGTTNYIIQTLDNKQYIYICSLNNIYNIPMKVHYAKDISNIYAEKLNYYTFFIKLDILICFIFAIFMFFISRLITKPINKLIMSTQKISLGEYSERLTIKSKDEFNILSTHFNLMAQTIEDKINELETSNIEKETFINNLTHELKTPLTSIIGYANLIRTSKYNEELFFESADYIYKEGKRLEQMAFKMMDLIYTKSQEITLIPCEIMDIIEDAKKSLDVKLKAKDIDLIIEGENCVLNIDKDLIKMLICNLVENSIKFSENNSKVYITVSKLNDKASISIVDSGAGISKEHLNKIWQPFYVVDKARSRKNNGAGIGLSICKKIVDVHNAQIKINSELGKGTQITIIF